MKKLTCLLVLVFCFSLYMMAQVKKTTAKPATPPMPDIEKMLKELPADQRDAVKEMMGNTTTSAVNKNEVVKPPASPIIQIKLKQPLQVPTEAQAKDSLLWYKGKKMNDSMLVTTKAMVVLYSKKRSMVIVQPLAETDPFGKMVNNVSREAAMTDDYIEKEAAKKNSFMNYPLIKITVDKFEGIDEQFNNAIKNTIDLPQVPLSKPVPGKSEAVGIDEEFKPKQDLAALHTELKQLLQNEPDMNFESPPQDNFSIAYRCDKDAQKHYWEKVKNWREKFAGYEYNLFRTYLSINQIMQIAEMEKTKIDYDLTNLTADLAKAKTRYYSRLDEKTSQLISRYGKNIFMQSTVITTALGYERQKQLYGEGKGADLTAIALMAGPEFENYMNEQINKKNWDVILDYSMILGRDRTLHLCGYNEGEIDRLYELYERIVKLNRFALTVDIDFNVQFTDDDGEAEIKANGTIQTKDKVYVCLAPIACKWTLRQTEVDYGKGEAASYIPMQVTGGIKSVKDEEGDWEDFPYSGSKDMLMYLPVFRIAFSDKDEQDTATMELLKYPPNVSLDFNPIGQSYKTDLLSYLNFVFVVPEKTAANEKEAEEMGEEMMSKFSVLTIMPNSATTLGKLKDQYLLMQQKQEMEIGIANMALTAKAVILFNAQNKSSILVDDKVDTKHKDEELEVTKGIFKVKVVHDPISN